MLGQLSRESKLRVLVSEFRDREEDMDEATLDRYEAEKSGDPGEYEYWDDLIMDYQDMLGDIAKDIEELEPTEEEIDSIPLLGHILEYWT